MCHSLQPLLSRVGWGPQVSPVQCKSVLWPAPSRFLADVPLPAKSLRRTQEPPGLGSFSIPGEPTSGKQEGQRGTTLKDQPLFGLHGMMLPFTP